MTSDHAPIPPGVWRVGGSKPRNLYIGEDYDIGRMDSPELAAHIVVACNHYSVCEQIDRSSVHEPGLGGPTQWAYDQACRALGRYRQRARDAEAELDRARQANDIDRHKELLARGSCHDREIQDVLYQKLITAWRVDEDGDRYEADCATCNWRTDGYETPVKEAGYEHVANVHMAYLDEVIAPILLLEADQRIGREGS